MQDNWLKYIDELFKNKNNNNRDFIYYPNCFLKLSTNNVNMVFHKNNWKTKLLFEDINKRKIYFSDQDIINILIESPIDVFEVIIEVCKDVVINQFGDNKMFFFIEGKDFYLPFPNITTEQETLLCVNKYNCDADFEITYYDLTILIFMIVHKEFISAKSSNQLVMQNRQLKKFIILSLFYKKGEYKQDLEKAGYDTAFPIEEVYKGRYMKQVDALFDGIDIVITENIC
ncbi:hypothetical protein [Lysinibacillus fusiformis]|uniref:hypothetical protein n=1 Tax=Lysinibacillus fusiformis TaxID=28031 RepID=UPI0011A4E169|nr:hypothetical protein [Lysinibacillus fusiformis]